MKLRATLMVLGTTAAMAMATPSWAQGSAEHDDNGGKPAPGQVTQPKVQQPGPGMKGTTGQGEQLPSPNAQSPGRPNNPSTRGTDRSGNVPSENR